MRAKCQFSIILSVMVTKLKQRAAKSFLLLLVKYRGKNLDG